MIEKLTENLFAIWGIIIFFGLPFLFFLVDQFIRWRLNKNLPITAPRILKNLIIPTVMIHLFCLKILALPSTHLSLKVTETILSVFVISLLFNLINYLIFSEKNIITKKETIPKLGQDILHFILITIISACALSSIWGLDLGNLLTALGVSSLVIGLALQEPLGNLFNGVALLIAKPFQKGDWIQVGDETGKVEEFNWRSVKLINRFNELIIIPNNSLGKEKIKNLSRPNKVHAELITIGFSYQDSPLIVKEILLKIALKTEGVLSTPSPIPLTISYDDFYITYGLKFYIRDFEDQVLLKDKIMTELFKVAEERKLTIPFPVTEIKMMENKIS